MVSCGIAILGGRFRHFALALLLLPGAASASAQDPRPNILWITSEDNGPHLGCYGDSFARTPHLDALAARGLRYERVWSNAPVCAPARTTIITGVHATSLGAEHMRSRVRLPSDMHLFPHYLREAGYYCVNRAKEDYNVEAPSRTWDESSGRAHWRNRDPDQPFFSVINLDGTHESRIRARPHAAVHDPEHVRVPAYHPDHPAVRRDWAQYHDKMTEMDARVGAILQELDADGLTDSTIVFYFGDHGPGMPRCKRWPYDSGLRVPLIVVIPERFAALAPRGYAPGAVGTRLVSFVDLAPTVLGLAGMRPPRFMQGRAFAGVEPDHPPRYLYGYRGRMDERIDLVRSITDGRFVYIRNDMPQRPQGAHVEYMFRTPTTRTWKALFDAGQLTAPGQRRFWEPKPTEELYDLVADPDEVHDLLAAPSAERVRHEADRARLAAALRTHLVESRDLGFLPEDDVHRAAGTEAPYDFGQSLDAATCAEGWDRLPAVATSSPSGRIDRAETTLAEGDPGAAADARATLIAGADLRASSPYLALRALNAIDAADAARPWPNADVERLRALPRTRDDIPSRLDGYVSRLLDHILDRHPAAALTPPRTAHVYRRIDGIELMLFVHQPAGTAPDRGRPAVVFFHGGGWTSGDPAQFFDQCAHVAERGVVGISAAYRLGRTHGTPPTACVVDGKAALRWVRAHAGDLGVDPDRIAAGGGSAGGHIAAAIATLAGFDDEPDADVSCRPNALVLFNPVFDNGPGGWGHQRVRDTWKGFSPLHNVRPGIPPSLVLLGTRDALVPIEAARRWERRVADAGGQCEVVLFEGAEHGFFNRSRGAEGYADTVRAMDSFLEALGWLAPVPP